MCVNSTEATCRFKEIEFRLKMQRKRLQLLMDQAAMA